MTFVTDILMIAITVASAFVGQMLVAAFLHAQVISRVQIYAVLYAVYLCTFIARSNMLALLALQQLQPAPQLVQSTK